MGEIFHEDILETFLFCFLASLGIIQVAAARRGWHGLSLYGGRIQSNVNNALGAALLISSYAWYFSDPLHRNVRNIEALMSMVCLFLGILAAAAFSMLCSSLSESLRRYLRVKRASTARDKGAGPREITLTRGKAFLYRADERSPHLLVVMGEPGSGNIGLMRALLGRLPESWTAAVLQPCGFTFFRENPDPGVDPVCLTMLQELEDRGLLCPKGGVFLGLGWGANELLRSGPTLEKRYTPARMVALAPVIPDRRAGVLGDALGSNTPWDILRSISSQKPWREGAARALLRLWIPVAAICMGAATAVTVSLNLRWSVLSGVLGGLLASVWVGYFLAARRGLAGTRPGWEERALHRLSRFEFPPLTRPNAVIIVGEDSELLEEPSRGNRPFGVLNLAIWKEALRGKFLLDGSNLERLLSLLASGETADQAG